ncbi:MAG: glycosyltransferase, partial [Bacteroidota bacterium]
MNERKNILYLSYDGMTDPLGQSQVLPYIVGLSKAGYSFSLISFEKKHRFQQYRSIIEDICKRHNIKWYPLSFSSRPPFVSKLWDVYRMKQKAKELHTKYNFSMTHCRSYQSAEVGLFLKQKFGVKFFFDMRGFWVDERVDGNLWNMENPFYKWAYNFYKKKEASFIHYSDIIISLTEAGKREIQKWKSYQHTPIGVIPCSADFELFSLTNDLHKKKARELLGLPDNSIVMSYLGSIGTWYLLEEMLDFFKQLKLKYPNAKFLFITPTDKEEVINIAKFKSIAREDIVVKFAKRNEVTSLMKASDFSIFFIKPAYSKIASSPT